MKKCKTYREFKKIVRKYWKKHAVLTKFKYNGKKHSSYWTNKDFCYYEILKPSELDNEKIKEHFMFDMPSEYYDEHLTDFKNLFGKQVYTESCEGKFVSFVITNRTVYLCILNDQNQYELGIFYGIPKIKKYEQ